MGASRGLSIRAPTAIKILNALQYIGTSELLIDQILYFITCGYYLRPVIAHSIIDC